jgi:uncharacterized protein YndB with AHSA1/START domain
MTNQTREAEKPTAPGGVDLDRDPRAIVGTREFDAPRALVFSAWTDPKHLAQWWGPYGFTTTTSSFDFRPGGVWRFVMHGPDGRDYQNRITFEEIVAPERIVYRHGGGDDVEPVQFRTTIILEDLGSHPRDVARRVPVRGGTQSRHQRLRRRQRSCGMHGAACRFCCTRSCGSPMTGRHMSAVFESKGSAIRRVASAHSDA